MQSLKLSAIGLIVMILAGGACPALPLPDPVISLSDIYNDPSRYDCDGRACVNAETPYYSARIANGGLSKILLNIFSTQDLSKAAFPRVRIKQLFSSNFNDFCEVLPTEDSCVTSTALIAVNFALANRTNDKIPSAYADKVTVRESVAHEVTTGRLVITSAKQTEEGALRVGIGGNGDKACGTTSSVTCIDIALSKLSSYTNVTEDYWLPVVLAGLRATQLFTLFPNASNKAVVGMLLNGNNTDCIVHLRCSVIVLFLSLEGTLQDFYEHPDLYSCGGKACVNTETPYYSALVAKGDNSDLTKIFINVWANDDGLLSRFFELLLDGSGYVCTLVEGNSYCGTSPAPIAVGISIATLMSAIPEGYRDKVTVMNLLSEESINSQGDRLIITPATDVSELLTNVTTLAEALSKISLRVGTEGANTCAAVNCVNVPLSNFDTYKNITNDYLLPVALAGLRAAQLFTMFPNATNDEVVEMLLGGGGDCIVHLQCLAITDSFTEDTETNNSADEAGSTTRAPASASSASSAGSAGSGSASSAGSSNSFISDIGSMTTYGKRQVFWSDGGLSVETRSHKIYRGGAHAMALAYRSMMGTLDITTGWTSQSSALGMEQMFFSGSSLGVFGALRYDAGSYLGMRPYVGVVASWHSMLETPKNITIMTANEVHVRAGVAVDVKGMRFALEGRCGQHQRLIGYGALSSALAETSCSTHLKASVSF